MTYRFELDHYTTSADEDAIDRWLDDKGQPDAREYEVVTLACPRDAGRFYARFWRVADLTHSTRAAA